MADVADLALVYEVAQRAERLVDVGVRVRAVDLVQVDPVGLQPAQRVLDLADDPPPGVATLVGVVSHRHVDLAGEHDAFALTCGERLANDLLGFAGGVDVGGVDEVDPGIERAVDDADALVVILGAPLAEHHRAEAQLADRDARASQDSVLHCCSCWFRRSPRRRSVVVCVRSCRSDLVDHALRLLLGGVRVRPRPAAGCTPPR